MSSAMAWPCSSASTSARHVGEDVQHGALQHRRSSVAGGKHGRVAMSRSPWVRPGTWNSCAGGDAPAMLQRSPFALQWCPALRRRWAPQNNSCAFHRIWKTTRWSLRSRSAAKSCLPCSTSVIGGRKHELHAIVYFDLHFRFSCPQQFLDRWLGVAGGRAPRNMTSCNQSAADALRSFCGPTPVLTPSQRSQSHVENVLR